MLQMMTFISAALRENPDNIVAAQFGGWHTLVLFLEARTQTMAYSRLLHMTQDLLDDWATKNDVPRPAALDQGDWIQELENKRDSHWIRRMDEQFAVASHHANRAYE